MWFWQRSVLSKPLLSILLISTLDDLLNIYAGLVLYPRIISIKKLMSYTSTFKTDTPMVRQAHQPVGANKPFDNQPIQVTIKLIAGAVLQRPLRPQYTPAEGFAPDRRFTL